MMKAGWCHPPSIGRLELIARQLCKGKASQPTNKMLRLRTKLLHKKMSVARLELSPPQKRFSIGMRWQSLIVSLLLRVTWVTKVLEAWRLKQWKLHYLPRHQSPCLLHLARKIRILTASCGSQRTSEDTLNALTSKTIYRRWSVSYKENPPAMLITRKITIKHLTNLPPVDINC